MTAPGFGLSPRARANAFLARHEVTAPHAQNRKEEAMRFTESQNSDRLLLQSNRSIVSLRLAWRLAWTLLLVPALVGCGNSEITTPVVPVTGKLKFESFRSLRARER